MYSTGSPEGTDSQLNAFVLGKLTHVGKEKLLGASQEVLDRKRGVEHSIISAAHPQPSFPLSQER